MKWTPEANTELRRLFKDNSINQLALAFNTTAGAIREQCKRIGLYKRSTHVPIKRIPVEKEVVIKDKIKDQPKTFKRPPAIYNNINWYEETLRKYA